MSTFEQQVGAVLAAVGAQASISVREIDGDAELGVAADEPVVLASVFKVPVLVELTRRVAAGDIDPRARVRVAAAQRSPGPTGLSVMRDDVELSVRDLALSMMSVSDNAATDVVMDLVGVEHIQQTLRELGLASITVTQTCRDIYAAMAADMGIDSMEDLETALADPQRKPPVLECIRGSSVLDPSTTNAGTPADVARLLQLIWTDRAGPPQACAEMRRILALQAWPHRLRSGFPETVKVSGKTGTLPFARNEAGVVELPHGARFAVAVFLRPFNGDLVLPEADHAIGALARLAVDHLSAS